MAKKKAASDVSEKPAASANNKTVDADLRARMEAANEKLKKIIKSEYLPVIDDGAEGAQDLSIRLYSTGIMSLDRALSGGLPVGRMTELYGEEGSGKSLISLVTIGEMQKNGAKCLLFDTESAYEPQWAAKLGVDTSKLMVSDSNVIEDVFKIIEAYAEAKVVDLIVVDSLANLTTLDIMESELGAPKYSSVPLSLSRILPRISKTLKRNNTSLILVNQVRDVMGAYVPTLKTPGGRNLKHLYHTRIKCNKANKAALLMNGDVVTGVEIDAQVTKHRGGANLTRANFRIDYASGIDRIYDVVSFLIDTQHITRAGAFYTYSGVKYQGLENLMDAFRKDAVAYDAAKKFCADILSHEATHSIVQDASKPEDTPPDLSKDEDKEN